MLKLQGLNSKIQQKQFNCVQQSNLLQAKKLQKQQKKILAKILYSQETCKYKDASSNMALPQAAFTTCKVRELRERDMIISRMKTSGTDKNDLRNVMDNQKQMDYAPLKYNEKLMTSIWGLYNRYSPHNVKKNEYAPKKY